MVKQSYFCLKKKNEQDVTSYAGYSRSIGTLPSLASIFFFFVLVYPSARVLVVVSGDYST